MPNHDANLLNAASLGNVPGVNQALESGADVGAYDAGGYNALHRAAIYNQPTIIETLLEGDFRVNDVDRAGTGDTALHLAIKKGSIQAVSELLRKGDDGDGFLYMTDTEKLNNARLTPLHCAARCGCAHSASLLLDADVDANRVRPNCISGFTALHFAAQHGHANVIDVLLADDDVIAGVKTHQDKTALHIAAENGKGYAIRILAERTGKSLSEHINDQDENGNTALHLAVQCLDAEKILAFKALVKQIGIDTESRNEYDQTPLESVPDEYMRSYLAGVQRTALAQQGRY